MPQCTRVAFIFLTCHQNVAIVVSNVGLVLSRTDSSARRQIVILSDYVTVNPIELRAAMANADRGKKTTKLYATKKCPECLEILRIDEKICHRCKKKVGKVNKDGYAEKPINWRAYITCLMVWVMGALFFWWAFLRK
jgi:hypothetical protein